jgi:hypothetical protein
MPQTSEPKGRSARVEHRHLGVAPHELLDLFSRPVEAEGRSERGGGRGPANEEVNERGEEGEACLGCV